MRRFALSSRYLLALSVGGAALFSAVAALRAAESSPVAAAPTAEQVEFFEKKVRPLLADQCYACHNSKSASPMGGLVLDNRAALMKGGDRGASVVPGDVQKSLLLKAVRWEDRHLQMPPKGKLEAAQISDLEAWVKMGAPWPGGDRPAAGRATFDLKGRAKHWSFRPLKRITPPLPRSAGWARSPIDRFILASLEAKGLKPAPAADRRTLIRRVTYDLIGLPPTPEEVEAFVQDRSPNAWEKVVDRLLASPHYGERWGRHWLDLVRFAETDGHEFDFEKPNAFMYRDYVVRAFNADVPYRSFGVEHLAGDLLAKPRLNPRDGSNESVIATGFWFLGEGKHSPVDLLEDEAERVDNQIDVTSKAFLGLSMGCARCHDHKFDPVSAKDYYAFSGFLRSSRQQSAAIDAPEPIRKAAADLEAVNADLKVRLTEKTVEAQRPRLDALAEYLLAAREVLRSSPAGASGDVVFEDFEKGYGAWKSTGTAFGDRPNGAPLPKHQGELNFLGAGLVNTHSARAAEKREVGDELTGTLTSPEFTVEKPYIRFLIGGGKHEGTSVILLVDEKVERRAHGRNENRMEWSFWDVRDLAGRKARIRVVDEVTGPWGNIGLDHVLFADHPTAHAAQVAKSAGERKLDPEHLAFWVKHLGETALRSPADPFHPFARLAAAESFEKAASELLASLSPLAEACAAPSGRVFEDFSGQSYDGWWVTGEAFGAGPTSSAAPRLQGKGTLGLERVVAAGVADSGRVSDRLQGTLRSKTFTLEQDKILFRMVGKDAEVNVVIDSFQRIRNPIYGGLKIEVNSPSPRWHAIDIGKWAGHRAYIEVLDHGRGYVALDQIRFAAGAVPPEGPSPAVLKLLEGAEGPEVLARRYQVLFRRTVDQWAAGSMDGEAGPELVNWLLTNGPAPAACDAVIGETAARRAALEEAVPEPRRVLAITDGTPENQRLYIRGSHKTLGEEVPRRFLEMFAGTAGTAAEGSGRAALAQKLTQSPLFPRVWVNRVWMHHFGEGLVRTPDDFGLRGEKPTHPALLEWLASTFASPSGLGWSTKKLHRMLLLSSTYRMSSKGDPKAEAADPTNRLLHRMPVRRLEAEAIRDGMLAVSGRLDRTLGGPSVLPFLTPFMEGRGRPSKSGPLDADGRRSLYISVRRNFLTPMFLAFDYPIPFNTMGRRSVSTVPSQALVLMNNPFVVQQAGLWAQQVLAEKDLTATERIDGMYRRAFSRPPTAAETAEGLAFIASQKGEGPEAETRAWSDLAHVLLNLKEFIFVN